MEAEHQLFEGIVSIPIGHEVFVNALLFLLEEFDKQFPTLQPGRTFEELCSSVGNIVLDHHNKLFHQMNNQKNLLALSRNNSSIKNNF